MSDRLLNHTINNLYNHPNYDDYIKLCIKQFFIPKYIDININNIYSEYRHLIPCRISTLNLNKILVNIIHYYSNVLHYNNIRNNSIYALSMAYLQSQGLVQNLNDSDFLFACHRAGVIGVYYDEHNIFHTITLQDIIHNLVGSDWKI
jgi:hypothetical protein